MKLEKLESAKLALQLIISAYASESTPSLPANGSQGGPQKTAIRSPNAEKKGKRVVFSDYHPEIFLSPEGRMAAEYLLKLIHTFEIEKNEAVFEKKLRGFFEVRVSCLLSQINDKYPLYPIFVALAESIQKADETCKSIFSPESGSPRKMIAGRMLREILDRYNHAIDKKTPAFPEANVCFYEMAVSRDGIVKLFPYTEKNQSTKYNGRSLLAISAEYGFEDVAVMLLEAGFDVNKRENDKYPLDIALENNHIKIAELFAQKGAKTTTSIYWATKYDKEDVAIFFIQRGASILNRYDLNRNLLHISAYFGWARVAEICLETKNFPVEDLDSRGHDALHIALITTHIEIVRLFSKLRISDVLKWTVKNGRNDIAEIALNVFNGPIDSLPSVSFTSEVQASFLHYSIITRGWERVANILLDKKITPETLCLALHKAAGFRNELVVQKCISLNVDMIGLVDGKTPLFAAVSGGSEAIIVLLIQQPNIDLFAPCKDNKTIFDIVREKKWTKVEKALVEKGYSLDLALLAKETKSLREQLARQTEISRQQEQEIQALKATVTKLMEASTNNKQTENNSNVVGTILSFFGASNSSVVTEEKLANPNKLN